MIPNILNNEKYYYQFRPISRKEMILESEPVYKDIERLKKHELYFSPLEYLNDPLDGRVQFYWNAPADVWKGMIYHYTNILFERLTLMILEPSAVTTFNVQGYKDPNLPYKAIIREALNDFFQSGKGRTFLEQLSCEKHYYTDDVVLYFNCFVHSEILSLILSCFEAVFNFNERQVEFLTKMYSGDYSNLESCMLSENDSILESVKLFARTQGEFAREKIKTTDNAALYIKYLFCEDYFTKFQNALLFQWGVTSFTKDCTNALMWAHYADSHKGICMIFDIDDKLNQYLGGAGRFFEKGDLEYYDNHHGICRGGIYLGEVKYVDEIPEENVFKLLEQFTRGTANEIFSFYDGGIEAYCSLNERIELSNKLMNSATLQKTKHWEYEQEVRMLLLGLHENYGKKTSLKFRLSCLEGIIFGVKTSTDDKMRVIQAITEMYANEKNKPAFYQAVYSNKKNEIFIIPLRITNTDSYK